jgi:hypothetical protein
MNMPNARYGMECGVVKNVTSGSMEIVIAGGRIVDDTLTDSVEIFDLETLAWNTSRRTFVCQSKV